MLEQTLSKFAYQSTAGCKSVAILQLCRCSALVDAAADVAIATFSGHCAAVFLMSLLCCLLLSPKLPLPMVDCYFFWWAAVVTADALSIVVLCHQYATPTVPVCYQRHSFYYLLHSYVTLIQICCLVPSSLANCCLLFPTYYHHPHYCWLPQTLIFSNIP